MLASTSTRRLCGNSLLLTTTLVLASNRGVDVIIEVVTVFIAVTLVLRGRDPKTRFPAVKRLVLSRKVNTVTAASSVATTLGQSAGALRELGGDGGVLRYPVGQGILAVLNDTMAC
jgi:hypothetical protein